MHIIRGLYNLSGFTTPCVATIGNYDGVHKGHQVLIKELLKAAEEFNLPPLLITFEPQPNEFFNPKAIAPRLMRLREKALALEKIGLENILFIRFDNAFAEINAQDFIEKILVKDLNIKHLIVGDDFRFGKGRVGDTALLEQFGKTNGFSTKVISAITWNGQRISSTEIRKALNQSDLEKAEAMLGKPFGMSGRVAHGDKRGRIIGFPTANIFLHRRAVPISGVYAVKVLGLGEGVVYGVANVGTRPTVDGTRSLLEVHLFDFERTIYGVHLYVEFVKKLREEKKYESFEELKLQIFKDAEEARRFFS